jgi:hypothetical protein
VSGLLAAEIRLIASKSNRPAGDNDFTLYLGKTWKQSLLIWPFVAFWNNSCLLEHHGVPISGHRHEQVGPWESFFGPKAPPKRYSDGRDHLSIFWGTLGHPFLDLVCPKWCLEAVRDPPWGPTWAPFGRLGGTKNAPKARYKNACFVSCSAGHLFDARGLPFGVPPQQPALPP